MQISDFCREHKVAYLEVIDLMSFERETFGSVDDLPYKGLYQGLLGDINAIKTLIEWLGDDEFKSHKQGQLKAITFLYDQKLVCIFYVYPKKDIGFMEYNKLLYTQFKETIFHLE